MKIRTPMIIQSAIALFLFPFGIEAQQVFFDNASPDNGNFSNPGNWEGGVLPGAAANLSFREDATTAISPAIVDPAWTGTGGTTRIWAHHGVFVEIDAAGVLRANNLMVGWENSDFDNRDGFIHLKSGGSIISNATIGGRLDVGVGASNGTIVVDPDATFRYGRLILGGNGKVQFNFGEDTVTTFVNIQTGTTNDEYALNGLIAVDLAALTTVGTYTLMESTIPTITGDMATWLDGTGGSFSGVGDGVWGGGVFETINAAGFDGWTLALANDGRNLEFTVIPEPRIYGALIGMFAFLLVLLRRHQVRD